jgi:uncharacterized protein YkwD
MKSCVRVLRATFGVSLSILVLGIWNLNVVFAQVNTTKSAGSKSITSYTSELIDASQASDVNPTSRISIQTLSAKAINGSQIELKWGITNLPKTALLMIFRASSSDPRTFINVGSISANLNKYLDLNLKPRTTYYYQLKYGLRNDGANQASQSNVAFATTAGDPEPSSSVASIGRRSKPGDPAESPTSGIGSAIPYDEREEELLQLMNLYRATQGLGPVRPSIALSQAADLLSRRLAEAGGNKLSDVADGDAAVRARMFNFLNDLTTKFSTAIFLTRGKEDVDLFERMKAGQLDKSVVMNPNWKSVGIARAYDEKDGVTRWVFDFADSWDRTIPIPGEDADGRIDGNDRVRTRPPIDALLAHRKFSGYGADGKPYSTTHCDLVTNQCWKDPAPAVNRSLRQLSLPENMIGLWHAQYQMSAKGAWHFNDADGFDRAEFSMSLLINRDGTWVSQGYKSFQMPAPREAGTWKSVHDAGRDEEIVTFYREGGRQAATIRVHAAPKVMTLFAVDGGAGMQNFFRGAPADADPKDDPQIIFLPGAAPAPTAPIL